MRCGAQWRGVVRGNRQRTRWLANAEVDNGCADASAESGAREPGAGAAVAKAVRLADRDADAAHSLSRKPREREWPDTSLRTAVQPPLWWLQIA